MLNVSTCQGVSRRVLWARFKNPPIVTGPLLTTPPEYASVRLLKYMVIFNLEPKSYYIYSNGILLFAHEDFAINCTNQVFILSLNCLAVLSQTMESFY